jgi:hypothetical protein
MSPLNFREAGKVLDPITYEPKVQLMFDVSLETLMDGPLLLGREEFINEMVNEISIHFRQYLEDRI